MTLDTISKFCLTLPEKPERTTAARHHFNDSGLGGVVFLQGINGAKAGLKTIFPYAVDDTSGNFFCGHHETGIYLSHYMAWQVAALLHEPSMILEDDARLESGWKESTEAALRDVPSDFDFLFVGSCGAAGAMKDRVKGNIWNVRYPACFHCYVVSPKGALALMLGIRKMFGPVDLATYVDDPRGGHDSPFKRMRVFTVLPRKVSQFNTEIPD